jgi:hypothetical protein
MIINSDKIRSAKMTKIYEGKLKSNIKREKVIKFVDKALNYNNRHLEITDRD